MHREIIAISDFKVIEYHVNEQQRLHSLVLVFWLELGREGVAIWRREGQTRGRN